MTKKVIEHLEKLNTDCNMTAGLEAKLSLAVGAHVMLRRNIDTKAGLVNGAIGTVLSVAAQHVVVQFDNIPAPCKIEKVRSRFMVMKNFYICVSEAVPSHSSICCYYPQESGSVTGLCYCRPVL